MATLIIVVVLFVGKEKAGVIRRDASIFQRMITFFAIIVDGHPNLTNGSRKFQECHSIK
jgi:flagellar biosynthesis regulator FlaF